MGHNMLKNLWIILLMIPAVIAPTIGGTTELINVTYPGTLELEYSSYPWVFVNQDALLKFSMSFEDEPLNDGTVYLNVNGTEANITYNPGYHAYAIILRFNETENGTKNWLAEGQRIGYEFKNLTGNFKVTDGKKAIIKIYKGDENDEYKNNFGFVLALPYNGKVESRQNWENQLQPMQDFIIWGDRTFGQNKTKLYKYPQKVWHAPYIDKEAMLVLPGNQGYLLYFVSGNYVFEGDYGYAYYTKTYTDKVYLGYVMIEEPVELKYLISEWDLNKVKLIILWVATGLASLLLICVAIVMMRLNPIMGISIIGSLAVLVPLIYYLVKLVLGL